MTSARPPHDATLHESRLTDFGSPSPAAPPASALRSCASCTDAAPRVAFVARTASASTQVARAHPGTHGIVGDVSRKEDIHPIALQITAALGGLDVLVNNASSLGPAPLALLADTECEDFDARARDQRPRPVPPHQGAARRA